MKKIKITEAQAQLIYDKLSKKKLKITASQLEMIKESMGGAAAVTKNWKTAAQNSEGLRGMKVENAGLIKEYGSVELLELARSVIEFMLSELNDPSQNGLDRTWRELGITRGEMITALTDAGLWGYAFFKLTYSDKVRAIGRGMKSLLKDLMSNKNQEGSVESTGASSSGSFTGPFMGGVSNSYNDELAPSNNVVDNSEGIITDAVTNEEELKGLEVGTIDDYFTVDGIEDRVTTDAGNIIFIIGLKNVEGTPTQSHLFFRYNVSNHKMSLMFAADEITHISAYKAFPEVYHKNLDTISNILTKMASQTDESTSYAGGSNVGAYDAPGFARGKKGKNLGGGTTQNFDVFSHDGSKVDGGVMNEMALTLQHDKENGQIGVASDETDSEFSYQDTFMIKDVLKKHGFRWNADIKQWTLPEKDFEKAKQAVADANRQLAQELEKRTTTPKRSYGNKEVKDERISRARQQADVLIEKLEDLVGVVAEAGVGGNFVMDKIKTYVNDLANATDEETLSAEMRRYLTFFAKFHKYSFNNKILIYIQNPNATRVAGMVSWKEKFGRGLKKGSKAIWILVPIMSKKKDENGNIVMTTDADGNSVPDEQLVGFKGGKVFDIADTYPYDKENGDIPETPQWWGENEESNTANELSEYLKMAADGMGINITKNDAKGGEKGFSAGNHINLSSDIKGVGEASTMTHEFAHELMHWKKTSPFYQQGTDGEELSKIFTRDSALWELQAESVSYVVLKHYGLPVTHHPTYLALWKANKDKILANMELISKVAQFIIDKVDMMAKKYPNVLQDKVVGAGESYMREASNLDDTAYPNGGFVDIDDCTKLNNNKEAQNGGCNQGDDGVVSVRKTKNSVISNQND
tara:strand:+ start:35840 stop:38434 length:2595 start_codon:yes stop_codon:yes gene_type:complete